MILHALALFALATLFGGMVLYSFGFAPLLFTSLPVDKASMLLRKAFPHYYLFVIIGAGVAAVALIGRDGLSVWLLMIVIVLGIAARQLLMPAINLARDAQQQGDEQAGSRFKRLHGLSVAINLLQLVLIAIGLYRVGIG